MAEANKNQDIKEGFICPICHKDLRSPGNLSSHFQELHSEEQDVLKSLKELVGKAKKKILKLEEQDLQLFKAENQKPANTWQYYENEEQTLGCVRSHLDYFKRFRRERLDHRTTETNRIIIRLDKLLKLQGADRKQQEQMLVTWLDGTTVTRCPSCASSFNLTKRQHHCRLCGSIMCNSCSKFLSHDTACIILVPRYAEASSFSNITPKSNTEDIRICGHCMSMLEYRRNIQLRQTIQLPLCTLYQQLQKLRCQIQPSVQLYVEMYSSLISGNTIYQLQDAQSLKSSIAKQAESLDAISKKIAAIPPDPDALKMQSVQNSIRRATTQYVKDYILTLPTLPNPAELENIKRDKLQRYEFIEKVPTMNIKRVTVATGWSPANVSPANVPETSDDPLIQQINIVRNYIEQARKAQRFEEVVSLQENLRMLKERYRERLQNENIES